MARNPEQTDKVGNDTGDGIGDGAAPVTLLCLKGSYWLYQGEDLLNDLLFYRGSYPFRVRCVLFEDHFDLNRFAGANTASLATMWRVNPDIVRRLRDEELLNEIFSTDV